MNIVEAVRRGLMCSECGGTKMKPLAAEDARVCCDCGRKFSGLALAHMEEEDVKPLRVKRDRLRLMKPLRETGGSLTDVDFARILSERYPTNDWLRDDGLTDDTAFVIGPCGCEAWYYDPIPPDQYRLSPCGHYFLLRDPVPRVPQYSAVPYTLLSEPPE